MIELLNMDCMEYMAGLPDKAFPLVIADPEYGLDASNMKVGAGGGLWKSNDYSGKTWDKKRATPEYFKEVFRVSKNQIIFGYNHFSDLLPSTRSVIVWDKTCHDKHTCDLSDCELAWCSIGGSAKIFRYLWKGMMQGSPADGTRFIGDLTKKEKRIHPTQKPIKLYKWLLKNYAKPGDKILDTHGGSMSIAIACHEMGFDLTLCEIDKDYYEAGLKRVADAMKQQKLFSYESELR